MPRALLGGSAEGDRTRRQPELRAISYGPGALLPVAAAWWRMPPGALGRTRRLRAVGGLVGPAQCRQVVGDRLVGLIVVAGDLFTGGDSPGGGPLAIGRWPWTVRAWLPTGRRPGLRVRRLPRRHRHLGTRAGRHGVAETGHDGYLVWGHRVASRPGGSPARAGGCRGLAFAAAPVSDHDQSGHHDQRRAQRNAGQLQSRHDQPPGERSHVVPYPASPAGTPGPRSRPTALP